MAPKVKIADFVASTARYSKKSALAADKNKDGRLTKTEAKSRPKDLRDDYARQAKTKSTIFTFGAMVFPLIEVATLISRARVRENPRVSRSTRLADACALTN